MTNPDVGRPEGKLEEPNAEDHISNDVAFWLGANFVSPAYWVNGRYRNLPALIYSNGWRQRLPAIGRR